MRRLIKQGLAFGLAMMGTVVVLLSGPARADLALAASCSSVPLTSEYDRAAAAAALPTFVGINQICVLQALLATVGSLPGSREVDGRYDRQTRDALKSFQTQNALASNGLLTPQTMDVLAEAALDRIFDSPQPQTQPEDTTSAVEITSNEAVPVDAGSSTISQTIEALKLESPEPTVVVELAKTQPTISLPSTSQVVQTETTSAADDANDAKLSALTPAATNSVTIETAVETTDRAQAVTSSSSSSSSSTPASPANSTVIVQTSSTALSEEEIAALVQEAARAGTLNKEPIVVSRTTTTTTITEAPAQKQALTTRIRDPLDDDTVSSFVSPSICHSPGSTGDEDLVRNEARLPVGTCLRTFVGAGNLPYQFYSLEVLTDGPTLLLLNDGDDTSFDAAIATLKSSGGRLVVMQSDETTRTTILGGNPEIMTVSPSLNARCDWAEEERPLAFAVHDYIVAGSKPVLVLRRNKTQRAVLDLFSDGKYRFDREALGPARELFVPTTEPLADQAFIELMVTSVTRRAIQTRGIIRTGVQEGLPVALTLVDALALRDQCSLEALAMQTDLPVMRVLLGESQDVASQLIIGAAVSAVGFGSLQGREPVAANPPLAAPNTDDIPASVLALAAGGLDANLNDGLSQNGSLGQSDESSPRTVSAAMAPGLPPLPLDRPQDAQDPLFANATELASAQPIVRVTTGISAGTGIDALSPVAVGGADGVVVSAGNLEGVFVEEAVGPVSALPPNPLLRPISDVLYRFVPDDIDPILAMEGESYYVSQGSGTGGTALAPAGTVYTIDGQVYDPNAQPRVISSRTIQTTVPTNPYAVPAPVSPTYTEVPTLYIQQQPALDGTGGVTGPLHGNGQNIYAPTPPSNETIIINNTIY